MSKQIQIAVGNTHVMVNSFPNDCPNCFRIMVPVLVAARHYHVANVPDPPFYALFTCTNAQCLKSFLTVYFPTGGRSSGGAMYDLGGLVRLPVRPSQTFPDAIAAISPQFIKVYEQAHAAEEIGLDQVTGLGYRKALEFLVKDYLIQQDPTAEEIIKKAMLGACIKDRIADPKMKEMAKRATWLGNDEAHYVRKWHDKDVRDMKIIIQILVNMIEQEHLFNTYLTEMPD